MYKYEYDNNYDCRCNDGIDRVVVDISGVHILHEFKISAPVFLKSPEEVASRDVGVLTLFAAVEGRVLAVNLLCLIDEDFAAGPFSGQDNDTDGCDYDDEKMQPTSP